MSEHEFGTESLRERFLAPPPDAVVSGSCPESEQILRAVMRELSVHENRRLADHAATCPACTIAWRLAREYAAQAGLDARRRPTPSLRRWLPAAAVLAVALLAVGIFAPWKQPDEDASPVFRTVSQQTIGSELPEERPLPAAQFVLRWTAGPEGARYDLRVTDRQLNPIHRASSLEAAEYTVPEAALAGLEPGAILLWQVEAVLPDGRRIVSETFAARLE